MKGSSIAILALSVMFVAFLLVPHRLFHSDEPIAVREEVPAVVTEKLTPTVEIFPERIIQGLPVMVRVKNANEPITITLNGKKLPVFLYEGFPSALTGVDLNAKSGTSTLTVVYGGNQKIQAALVVGERIKITAPLGIPEKLGGNTAASAQTLVNTLAEENEILFNLKSTDKKLWSEDFGYPLVTSVVTDDYGYTRSTVGQSISHKGVDFRAASGTEVLAMNKGEVRLVREFRNYGNTVVIDHGLGLMTFYMHLSETAVREGELIEKGQRIGKSGQTGYAAEPHLHVTIRIDHISIDPIAFLNLF